MPLSLNQEFFKLNPAATGFLDLFEFLPGIVFYAKDRSSCYVAANSTMLATKRLTSPSELLGRSDRDFHPPALAEAYIDEDRSIMETGKPLANQAWFVIDLSGRPGWFRSSKVPLHDADGSVIGLAGVRYAISTPEDRAQQFQNLVSAVHYLENNYTESISSSELAKLAGMSVTHFNRRFSEIFRLSPNQFLISLRVERARYLLSMTGMPIAEIVSETGFYDQSHFTRHFRKLTGMTPKKYRQQYRG